MNKIFIIVKREFLNRVTKKSFLVATILIPLIFPAIIAILGYAAVEQEKHAAKETVYYIDESNIFKPDTSKFIFKDCHCSLEQGKALVDTVDSFGLLYIPRDLNLFNPSGLMLFSRKSPSPNDEGTINWILSNSIKEEKMKQLNIDAQVLDRLQTNVSVETMKLTEGKEEKSNSDITFGIGITFGILMYMFIFIYGAQIMQGIIEEKTSKVVEVIVSSVRPFQLMMGKIIGLAAVGLLQFLIWIVLITTLTTVVLSLFGVNMPQQEMANQLSEQYQASGQNSFPVEFMKDLSNVPFTRIILTFLFYFLGGYLLYGALFAAVGSSVDSPAEAQQFMFPITIPMLISYMCLFIFIIRLPHSSISVWLSIIPFTSPIAMMGRIAFEPPLWQIILSMVLLVAGFIFTTWVAGRIYRVGILMHGTKVNYKVLAKWFMMKG